MGPHQERAGGTQKPRSCRTSTFLLLVLQHKTNTYLATVQETEIQAPGITFSNFSDEVRPEGENEKKGSAVALAHTHGSAPRNSYLPCQILARLKRSELEQTNEMSSKENGGRRDSSSVFVVGTFFVFCGQCDTDRWI